MGVVYICHHIDTEGPLWESREELFRRIELIFGIKLEPTEENLILLQNGSIDLPEDKKKELALVVDPHTVNYKYSWGLIEEMLERIMSPMFRNLLTDSFGGGWIYNWHIMDHVGFGSINPRHRVYGHHNIFDFYQNMIKRTKSNDRIHWHFHPVSFYKEAHIAATSYDNSMDTLHQVICRRLIDKEWFPVVNRAGFHSERVDSNLFLEQWMPFDPSNQAIDEDHQPKYQNDLTMGRFGDWRGAPSDWSIYRPDIFNWKMKGDSSRVIARVLNMKSRHRNITESEIEKAFLRASEGSDTYLGITNHDWREMSVEIDEFRDMLAKVSKKYPGVKFKFSETVEAFRKVLNYSESEIEKNKIELSVKLEANYLHVNVLNGEMFGPQPYLAIKTKNQEYFHDNFDMQEYKRYYTYTFDRLTIPVDWIDEIGIATNDKYGNCFVKKVVVNE